MRRGIGLAQVAAWMSAAPARLAGLTAKGRIAPGYDADLCVLAPDQSFMVDPVRLHHKHPATTPYAGRTLYGVVRATIFRGGLDRHRPAARPAAQEVTVKIVVVNVNTSASMTEVIAAGARRYASPGTQSWRCARRSAPRRWTAPLRATCPRSA